MIRLALVCAAAWLACAPAALAAEDALLARGAYLARIGGCVACHTAPGGAALAGGLAIATPFGTITTPNITPDRATGIGAWSEAEFRHALHDGIRPDGSPLYPAFPYPSFTGLRDGDVAAIHAWLMTQPAVHRLDTPPALRFPYSVRPLLWVWRALFFHPGRIPVDPAHDAAWNRGAYLVQAVAHCGECHSPRNALGGIIAGRALAGAASGPDGLAVPDITPDPVHGIGGWSADDLVTLLRTGQTPEQDTVSGAMAEAVDGELKYLTPDDAHAIAVWLLAQKPIR
ncbi:MAG: cytochrome c [Rhodospirillales bacterium]|nr:cytochrome c [Rhodospirillales bacterium]